jgi:predicted nucleic acid-binding protein
VGELYYGAYASQRVAENLANLEALVKQLIMYEFDAKAAKEFERFDAYFDECSRLLEGIT